MFTGPDVQGQYTPEQLILAFLVFVVMGVIVIGIARMKPSEDDDPWEESWDGRWAHPVEKDEKREAPPASSGR